MKKTVVPRASRVGALPLNTQPSTTDSSFRLSIRLSIRLSVRSSLRLSLRLCVDPRIAPRKVRDPLAGDASAISFTYCHQHLLPTPLFDSTVF